MNSMEVARTLNVERFDPSLAVHSSGISRPWTTILLPLRSLSAQASASFSHAVTLMNSESSFSPNPLTAIRSVATGVPLPV
jgi:hypothetical protein